MSNTATTKPANMTIDPAADTPMPSASHPPDLFVSCRRRTDSARFGTSARHRPERGERRQDPHRDADVLQAAVQQDELRHVQHQHDYGLDQIPPPVFAARGAAAECGVLLPEPEERLAERAPVVGFVQRRLACAELRGAGVRTVAAVRRRGRIWRRRCGAGSIRRRR